MRTPLDIYREAHKESPESLALIRVGDFYEAFYEDAEKASKVIGLTLTVRSKRDEKPIPMAGFPHQSLERYLPLLIAAGHRVAICHYAA